MDEFYDDLDWIDSLDLDEDESFDDDLDESARSRKKKRAKARRKVMAARARSRRNQQLARNNSRGENRTPEGQVRDTLNKVGGQVQQAKSAVEELNIVQKAQAAETEDYLKEQGSRISRTESALALSKVFDEFKEQFPDLIENPVIKAALPIAPMLLLSPSKNGKGGIESLITDPRIWAPAAVAAIALYKHFNKDPEVTVTLSPPAVGANAGANGIKPFEVSVADKKGKKLTDRKFKWYSLSPKQLIVTNADDGTFNVVAGVAAGTTIEIEVEDLASGKRAKGKVSI